MNERSEVNRLDRLVRLRDVIDLLARDDLGCLKGREMVAKVKPFHGSCCCCQTCGQQYDDCVCSHNELLAALMALEQPNNKLSNNKGGEG